VYIYEPYWTIYNHPAPGEECPVKSRDIAIVGILLAIGAIVRFFLLMVPGPITSNMVIAFYCLAIMLVRPTFPEAVGIGFVAGIISAMITHSLFPPANLISEPVGAVVCLALFGLVGSRSLGPAAATLVATLASGFTFVAVAVMAMAAQIIGQATTLDVFMLAIVPIVVGTAVVNAIIVQVLYIPASRVLPAPASGDRT